MKERLLKLLGLKADADDDALVAAVEELKKNLGAEHAGARVDGKMRILKAIAKHAGLEIDWSEYKGDDEALSALAVELGVKLKGGRGGTPPKKSDTKSDDDDAGNDSAADAAKAANEKALRTVQDSYITLALQQRNVFNADMVSFVLQKLDRTKLQFTKDGEVVTGVTIPDDEIKRLHTEMPSAFKQGVDIRSPAPNKSGDDKPPQDGELDRLHKDLAGKAADSVMGKAKQ